MPSGAEDAEMYPAPTLFPYRHAETLSGMGASVPLP